MKFILSRSTRIRSPFTEPPVVCAVSILERDMRKTLDFSQEASTEILLEREAGMKEEAYRIQVVDERQMRVTADSSLGFVYGLLFISEHFLNIRPFWFWMDQQIPVIGVVEIPVGTWESPVPAVRYRGWFLNDEVLLNHWENGEDREFPWRMAFEALLRCGGNMVIPGTDKSSRLNAPLAARYGLWLTHHHAEPLGAEIFARAYPDLMPSYSNHPDCFEKLWEEAVIRQKDWNVVWTLGFRGQGDCPFWESKGEECFDTPEKRGRLISQLIELQRQIVCRHVEHPVFCTNLYGEVMELYQEGHIQLHSDIIRIWADNGYGKMCTRRQDNHDARVPSLPSEKDAGSHGVYYHVSFHDLQAAGHMTTLPNTVDFVNRELKNAFRLGVDDYWIINASNIRPHVYYLDAIRKLWSGDTVSDQGHSREFAAEYFGGKMQVGECLERYAASLLSYGKEEDQHAGEQFYNYCVRLLARQFLRDRDQTCEGLFWLTGSLPLMEQAAAVEAILRKGEGRIADHERQCREAGETLTGMERTRFEATVLLQARIHHDCCQGALRFCQGLLLFSEGRFQESFYQMGLGAEWFDRADAAMEAAEYGVWRGFYENDCLTDIRFTAYMIRTVMRLVRVIGDDARLASWYEDYFRSSQDRKVRLLSITEHHKTDEELFAAMKDAATYSGTLWA